MRETIKQTLVNSESNLDENEKATAQIDQMDFLEFRNLEQSVRDDVQFLRDSPLMLKGTTVTGWIHNIDSGEVRCLSSQGVV